MTPQQHKNDVLGYFNFKRLKNLKKAPNSGEIAGNYMLNMQ